MAEITQAKTYQTYVPPAYRLVCSHYDKGEPCPYEHTFEFHIKNGTKCKFHPRCRLLLPVVMHDDIQSHLASLDHSKRRAMVPSPGANVEAGSRKSRSRANSTEQKPRTPSEGTTYNVRDRVPTPNSNSAATETWKKVVQQSGAIDDPEPKTCIFHTTAEGITFNGRPMGGYYCGKETSGTFDLCDACFATAEGKAYLAEYRKTKEFKTQKKKMKKAVKKELDSMEEKATPPSSPRVQSPAEKHQSVDVKPATPDDI